MMSNGGEIVDLMARPERVGELTAGSRDWPSWDLTPRQLADLELLLGGLCAPLDGFMGRADHASVCQDMRLADGRLWPMPLTLDVSPATAERIRPGSPLALRDPEGILLAALHVREVWEPDRLAEARAVYGTTDRNHPGVAQLLDRVAPCYVGGALEGVQRPIHYDFPALWRWPSDLRRDLAQAGHTRIASLHTSGLLHRLEVEMTRQVLRQNGGALVIHAAVGPGMADEGDHFERVRCCQAVLGRYRRRGIILALRPWATRLAGPREALWRAMVDANTGATHVVVMPGDDDALLRRHAEEIGVALLAAPELRYDRRRRRYRLATQVAERDAGRPPDAAEVRRHQLAGRALPAWFTYPEVNAVLRRAQPSPSRPGFTVFLTGLPSSGKSTIANVLRVKLLERTGRRVTLLDGDVVRKHLSSELGFSREHRDLNVRRIAFVASEVTRHGGIAICAPIAPYDATRRQARAMIAAHGGFVLVLVSTPLDVCEGRDRKGLYAKARAGLVQGFTGVSDPYEMPDDADVVLDTTKHSPEEAADAVLDYLEQAKYLRG